MQKFFQTICDTLMRSEDLVLCTIIASSGSTPRGSGAKMAVFADGSTIGTVGGGAVEFESIKLAQQALQQRANAGRGHAFRRYMAPLVNASVQRAAAQS